MNISNLDNFTMIIEFFTAIRYLILIVIFSISQKLLSFVRKLLEIWFNRWLMKKSLARNESLNAEGEKDKKLIEFEDEIILQSIKRVSTLNQDCHPNKIFNVIKSNLVNKS